MKKNLWRKYTHMSGFLTSTLWQGSTAPNYTSSLHVAFLRQEQSMPSANIKVLTYPKVARPDVLSIPYINIYVKEFLWIVFVTMILLLKSTLFSMKKKMTSPCFSLSFCDTPLAVPWLCHQNNTRQALPTAGAYWFAQHVPSPAVDEENKHLPKKMKANAKMSHRFPVKIPF